MTEEEVLAGIKEGRREALAFLYKAHYKMVSHFVLNNQGTEDDAKDVYQEAVIVLYEKARNQGLQLSCKISTYLYSICRHLWLRKLALQRHYIGKIEEKEAFVRLEEQELDTQENDLKAMQASLSLLGEPCRAVVEAYYIRQMSMAQICESLGYANAETAKNQKYKCLLRLKKLFFGIQHSQHE